mmetsp:Transcript_33393/g.52549  ORF Transcript_33393/g.52549 Transcript_33393/m.52549 type:complete len:234 (+) Transcript_33393:196-897(+)
MRFRMPFCASRSARRARSSAAAAASSPGRSRRWACSTSSTYSSRSYCRLRRSFTSRLSVCALRCVSISASISGTTRQVRQPRVRLVRSTSEYMWSPTYRIWSPRATPRIFCRCCQLPMWNTAPSARKAGTLSATPSTGVSGVFSSTLCTGRDMSMRKSGARGSIRKRGLQLMQKDTSNSSTHSAVRSSGLALPMRKFMTTCVYSYSEFVTRNTLNPSARRCRSISTIPGSSMM